MHNAHYRRIAGNLWFFVGAYLIAFGMLAAVYFERLHRPNRTMAAGAAALAGILLVARAGRMLAWHPWIYWTLILISVGVPVGYFAM